MKYSILIDTSKCAGCLVCQMRCSLLYTGTFNPAKAFINIDWPIEGGTVNSVQFTEGCTYCGVCARFCAYGALTLAPKA